MKKAKNAWLAVMLVVLLVSSICSSAAMAESSLAKGLGNALGKLIRSGSKTEAAEIAGAWLYYDMTLMLDFDGVNAVVLYDTEGGEQEEGTYTLENSMLTLVFGDLTLDGVLMEDGTMELFDIEGYFYREDDTEEYKPAYFDEKGLPCYMEPDGTLFMLEKGGTYYRPGGNVYLPVMVEYMVTMDGERRTSTGEKELSFTLTCFFPNESNPQLYGQYNVSFDSCLCDYYSGTFLLTYNVEGDSAVNKNMYSYDFDVNGETVHLEMSFSVEWEEKVQDCDMIAYQHFTVSMPVDYDGLVLSMWTMPDTMDKCIERVDIQSALAGMDEVLYFDKYEALYCRIW